MHHPPPTIYTFTVPAEIIAIGSELLTPHFQDTNSLYLTEKLNGLGVEVAFKTVVGDNREHLTQTARIALARADIIIFMGGLGPTEDDLTRECVAAALGRELRRDPELVHQLHERFAKLRRQMADNNEKQADVIDWAQVLPNPLGTAPGQWIDFEYEGAKRYIMLLPGPPHEIKPMFDEQCIPRLRERLPQQFIATRVLKIAMMGESDCDRRAAPIYQRFPDVQTTILAGAGDIQLRLTRRAESQEAAQARVDELAGLLEDELEDFVYSSRGESLEQIVGYYLQMRGATIAVAESCTGGLLGERITKISGSSRYFVGGAIVYDNEMKTLFANVPPALIAEHGAVSKEVAAALAEGIREECRSTIGVGITGVAGPTGGTEEKPVGLLYIAVADGKHTDVVERNVPGDRARIRWWASQQALDMVRRKLI
ncbi:MAG TPA: competence/damage-inducible protein A [Terriglobales bacterium]|nr:competence/damage-inducible protein A [Terriglobales bacterium]